MNKLAISLSYLFFLLVTTPAFSQQLISTAGDVFQGPDITLSWSIGGLVTETVSNEDFMLTQGFQQIYFDITDIVSPGLINPKISIYPNPIGNEFIVSVKQNNTQKYTLRVYNLMGILLKEQSLTKGITIINATDLQGNIFMVEICNRKNKVKKTFKLIKKQYVPR